MKTLLLCLIIITAPLAYAESIHFGVYTRHVKANEFYNNDNNLIAIQIDKYYVSSFTNSFGYQTYFAGLEKKINSNISIVYGLSHGYSIHCFLIFGGSNDECATHKSEPDFVPLATIRLHHNIGPIVVSTMLADYLNIALGVEF